MGGQLVRLARLAPPSGVATSAVPVHPLRPCVSYKEVPFFEEDPWVREQFEAAAAEQGLQSLMPSQIYEDPDYIWDDPEMRDKD